MINGLRALLIVNYFSFLFSQITDLSPLQFMVIKYKLSEFFSMIIIYILMNDVYHLNVNLIDM